jgi:hypothetical protein
MARTTFSGPVVSQNGFITESTNGNVITFAAPAGLSASYTFTLPPNDGSNGQVLTTDGDGVTTWTTNGVGTVTSVGGAGTVNGLTLTGTVTSSGSLTLGGQFALPQTSVAALNDATNAINTTGKYIGKMAVDLSDGIIYTSAGVAAGDDWLPSDGGSPISPTNP